MEENHPDPDPDPDHTNDHAPQRQPQPQRQQRNLSTTKLILLTCLLVLILILTSTAVTLKVILRNRTNAIRQQQQQQQFSNRNPNPQNNDKDHNDDKKLPLSKMKSGNYTTRIQPSDVRRFLYVSTELAPDPTSDRMSSDAHFGVALKRFFRSEIRNVGGGSKQKQNALGVGVGVGVGVEPYVVLANMRSHQLDDNEKAGLPHSSNVDYRAIIYADRLDRLRRRHRRRGHERRAAKRKSREEAGVFVDWMMQLFDYVQDFEGYRRLVSFIDFSYNALSEYRKKMKRSDYKHEKKLSSAMQLSPKEVMTNVLHLKEASDGGNPEAQSMLAMIYASGIMPWSDNSKLNNETNAFKELFDENVFVTSDFSEGGANLAKALTLWHFAAIGGVQEAQMAMGYRYLLGTGGKYGVAASCENALAYYEAAANSAIDELEMSQLKGKLPPSSDAHRLSQIHINGGASSALTNDNKPYENKEALEYYRLLAIKKKDVHAAITLASLHSAGARGASQDLALAHKYYKIAADESSDLESCGQVGIRYLLGVGVEQDISQAYKYCSRGAPNDLHCKGKCDPSALNCWGLMYLRGVPYRLQRDVGRAEKIFRKAKELGSVDAMYNLGMLKLGWMGEEKSDATLDIVASNDLEAIAAAAAMSAIENAPALKEKARKDSELNKAYHYFVSAAKQGHIQSMHRAGMMLKPGVTSPEGNCNLALHYFKSVATQGPAMARLTRAAYKEYLSGNYEQALRHYLVAAEAGIEIAQSNAAFLLERGFCLGLDPISCASASLRLWKAASHQGNAEASLKVGDVHYYGKHREKSHSMYSFSDVCGKWKKHLIGLIRVKLLGEKDKVVFSNSNYHYKNETVLLDERKSDFEVAANFYRKAADAANPRANFNMGYMHQWGIGLKQDFPLAKRYYDFAGNFVEAEVPVYLALQAMKLHQWLIKFMVTRNISSVEKKVRVLLKHLVRLDTILIFAMLYLCSFLINKHRRRLRNQG